MSCALTGRFDFTVKGFDTSFAKGTPGFGFRDSVRFELLVGKQHVDIFPSLDAAKLVAAGHVADNEDVVIMALLGPLPCAKWQYDQHEATWIGPMPYGNSEH